MTLRGKNIQTATTYETTSATQHQRKIQPQQPNIQRLHLTMIAHVLHADYKFTTTHAVTLAKYTQQQCSHHCGVNQQQQMLMQLPTIACLASGAQTTPGLCAWQQRARGSLPGHCRCGSLIVPVAVVHWQCGCQWTVTQVDPQLTPVMEQHSTAGVNVQQQCITGTP